jgi:sec-independent protein translocase protein TatB
MMANLGMADTLILMVLALVVFGPRRLPQIGRQIGKLMYEFRKASNDFKFQMEEELRQSEEADRRKKEEEERKRALAAAPPPAQIESPVPPTESPIQPAEPATPAPPPEPPADIAADVPNAGSSTTDGPAGESSIESPLIEPPPVDPPSVELPPASASPASEEPAPEASFEPPHPRIAPPSTGEKVAAARPTAEPEQQNLFADGAGDPPDPVAPETNRSEPAAHHG